VKNKNFDKLYSQFELSPLPNNVIDRAGLVVDTATNQWFINDPTGNFIIDWDLFHVKNQIISYALKRYILQRLKTVSPRESYNTWVSLRNLSKIKVWDSLSRQKSVEEIALILPQILSKYLECLRAENLTYQFARIRAWYLWCVDQELPGFDSEVMYDLMKIKIPGNTKGLAVMTDDSEQGPLTDNEVNALRSALIKDKGPLIERVCVWLCLSFGCNPANFILLRECDFNVKTFSDLNYPFYELQIPRIKKRGLRHQRADFKVRKADDGLAKLLQELIDENKSINIPDNMPRPLLMRQAAHKIRLSTSISEYSYHFSVEEFTELVRRFAKRLNVISPRTLKPLKLNPRRLRYTFATSMVRQGASAAELADLLDHTDLQHVQVYYNARSTIVERLDAALAEKLAPLVARFSGEIIDHDNNSAHIRYQEKLEPRKIHGIGMCGADYLCKLYPPLSCYLCEKFQPFRQAPHNKVLEDLTKWREKRLNEFGDNDRIAQQLDEVIYQVAQVNIACSENKEAANGGH
jgi:integrase